MKKAFEITTKETLIRTYTVMAFNAAQALEIFTDGGPADMEHEDCTDCIVIGDPKAVWQPMDDQKEIE